MTSAPSHWFSIADVWCSGCGCSCRPRAGQPPFFNQLWLVYPIAFVQPSLEASKKVARIRRPLGRGSLESDE